MRPIILLAAALIGGPLTAHAQSPVTGRARIIDGDSLVINNITIRLWGIDAPELHQTCHNGSATINVGKRAHEYLAGLTMGLDVTCETISWDTRYSRPLAICKANTVVLNHRMVEAGWAWAYRHYTHHYAEVEETAHANRRGVWGYTCTAPWDYRRTGR